MDKKDLVISLQSNLLKWAKVLVEEKSLNKRLDIKKSEFDIYYEQFKALIAKLPMGFYSNETDKKYVDEIIELSDNIRREIGFLDQIN